MCFSSFIFVFLVFKEHELYMDNHFRRNFGFEHKSIHVYEYCNFVAIFITVVYWFIYYIVNVLSWETTNEMYWFPINSKDVCMNLRENDITGIYKNKSHKPSSNNM